MHCIRFFIFIFILLLSFPPLNARTQSSSDMLPKSPLNKGAIASSTSFSYIVIAPTMLGMLDVGCIKVSASKDGTHTRVFMNSP